jgi:hypothetical protein
MTIDKIIRLIEENSTPTETGMHINEIDRVNLYEELRDAVNEGQKACLQRAAERAKVKEIKKSFFIEVIIDKDSITSEENLV